MLESWMGLRKSSAIIDRDPSTMGLATSLPERHARISDKIERVSDNRPFVRINRWSLL